VIIIRILRSGLKLLWCTPWFNSWTSFFLIYINDLPTLVNEDNNIVLYADDTSIVITDSNRADFNLNVNVLFKDLNNWFKNNLLNFTKTHYLEFRPTKHPKANIQIHYNHKYISNVTQTNFLGLTLDDTLTWKQHTDLLIKKMTSVSYALRQVNYSLPIDTLKLIYYAHVHSIMRYGVIFWGNSPGAKKVFKLQKKIIRIITHTRPRDPCKEIFKNTEIMTLYSIILFVVNNKYIFTTNSAVHKLNTRNNNNLHPALSNLTTFNKGPCISGIKAFNHLPQYLKALDHNSLYFRSALKRFLHHHSLYTIDEYYEYKENTL
jgi:hypothetical protein